MATRLAQAAGAAGLCFTAQAQAANCSDLPNIVLIAGSSAVKPFVAEVAKAFDALSGDDKITVIYLSQASCVGVNYFTDGASKAPTSTATPAAIWTGGTEGTCTLTDEEVAIGVSDVWPATCGKTLANDAREWHGPVQSMTFVKPTDSQQQPESITYKAAYNIFHTGSAGAAPWTDTNYLFVRDDTSGTQLMIGSVIGLTAGNFQGNNAGGSGNVASRVPAASWTDAQSVVHDNDVEKAIGILASDAADKNRGAGKLAVLAYQHEGQTKAYWPDSAPDKFDKQNVRDGHYMIWGPVHMVAGIDSGTGEFSNPLAQKVVLTLSGEAEPPAGLDLIKTEAKGSVVPDCAMQVTRDGEGGDLMCYLPPRVCECKYLLEATGTAPARCQSCQSDDDCKDVNGTNKCSFGYCEVR